MLHGIHMPQLLQPCSITDIHEFLSQNHKGGVPSRATDCFLIEDNGIKAAMACGPGLANNDLCEFIACAIAPNYPFAQSRLISLTVRQLRARKKYEVAFSWVNPDWGCGVSYKGASWYYSGRGSRTGDNKFSQNATGCHLYWWPLRHNAINKWDFLKLPYP